MSPRAIPVLVLLLTSGVSAAELEPHARRGGERVEVRVDLPPIYVEAEVLLDLDGVRMVLTREVSPRVPGVSVTLPNRSGTARLVLRAGRRVAGSWREEDVHTSPAFRLESSPQGPASRVVLHATARPFGSGVPMPELWSEDAAPLAPLSGVLAGRRRLGALPDAPVPLRASDAGTSVPERSLGRLVHRPNGAAPPPKNRPIAFPGAAIPLRN